MASLLQKIIGAPKKSADEQVRDWRREIAAEMRRMDTQARKIRSEEQKVVREAKKAAKMGDQVAVRILAKQILHTRQAVKRMVVTKTQLNSVSMQLQQQLSQAKVVGSLAKSAEIMTGMNRLMNVGEIRNTIMTMSREMTKAGLIDEMVADSLDSAMDDVEEDELDEEVDKVIADVLQEKMRDTRVNSRALPGRAAADDEVAEAEAEEEAVEEDDDELMAKYKALRGNA